MILRAANQLATRSENNEARHGLDMNQLGSWQLNVMIGINQ
jgi:hypothetical protein